MAVVVQRRMRARGLRPATELLRAPTSPTWAPLLRALFRVWAAAFLAGGRPLVCVGLAAAAVAFGHPRVAGSIRFVPLLGATSRNVVALRRGTARGARPLVIVAHLDTHPAAAAPMHRAGELLASASGLIALAAGLSANAGTAWRGAAALIAGESMVTLAWLAKRELQTPTDPPDDNTSGLLSVVRLAELLGGGSPAMDVWLVATGGGTSGNFGMTAFLRARPQLKGAWVIEIDALGAGEIVACTFAPRFPRPGTPSALTRAVAAAAQAAGEPLTVRRMRRSHSDARAALRARTGAIALVGGLRPPEGGQGPDAANAERAARIVDRLAGVS